MGDRASWWSITLNNPTDEDRNRIQNPPSWVKAIHFQEEVGAEGTPHIQGALNTAQVRFSQVKGWLSRAHIEIARNKEALLKYVKKTETAIAGTQRVIQGDYLTMDKALLSVASYKWNLTEWLMEGDRTEREVVEWKRKEFWNAVNSILLEKPGIVGLLTNPQIERAWIHTRETWIQLLDRQDRQTENTVEINSM